MRGFSRRRISPQTWSVLAGVLLGFATGHMGVRAMDDQPTSQDRASRPSRSSATRQQEEDFNERLTRILDNDQKILARFDEVMAELQTVKVRASLKRHRQDDP